MCCSFQAFPKIFCLKMVVFLKWEKNHLGKEIQAVCAIIFAKFAHEIIGHRCWYPCAKVSPSTPACTSATEWPTLRYTLPDQGLQELIWHVKPLKIHLLKSCHVVEENFRVVMNNCGPWYHLVNRTWRLKLLKDTSLQKSCFWPFRVQVSERWLSQA